MPTFFTVINETKLTEYKLSTLIYAGLHFLSYSKKQFSSLKVTQHEVAWMKSQAESDKHVQPQDN